MIQSRFGSQVVTTRVGKMVVFVPATWILTSGAGRSVSVYNDTDAAHGIQIPGLGVEVMLPEGEETLVELPELPAGAIFDVRCQLHEPHRHASLVVVPAR